MRLDRSRVVPSSPVRQLVNGPGRRLLPAHGVPRTAHDEYFTVEGRGVAHRAGR